ncbi:unnamed protein product [Auanema sp. JU1783]|nr:unnamed protein product [Auanema sp. JU1783]
MQLTICFFLLLGLLLTEARVFDDQARFKRQSILATEEGIEAPITLRSLITCLTPGIREHICLGPRVEVLKRERIGMSERTGAAYGYKNGVDIRLLKQLYVPTIEDQTEISHSIGAVVDADEGTGAVEFGERGKIFKMWKHSNGGVVEWDRQGAGVDVGFRGSAADDTVKVKATVFGVNVGPNARRQITGPYVMGPTKGEHIKPESNVIPSIYPGYYSAHGDWYRKQFERPGDQYRTPAQRACPWCFAVDPTYPTENIFNTFG